MPESTASRIAKLTAVLNRPRPSQLHWIEKVADALKTPSRFELGHRGLLDEVSGFDAGTQSVADLEKGDVQILVLQNPMRIGGDALKALVASTN